MAQVAVLAGAPRVPVAISQPTGVLAADGPIWYVTFQGIIGLVQVAVGLASWRATDALASGSWEQRCGCRSDEQRSADESQYGRAQWPTFPMPGMAA